MDKMSELMKRGAAITEPLAKAYLDDYDNPPTAACAIGCLILVAADGGKFSSFLPREYLAQLNTPIDTTTLPDDIRAARLDYDGGASYPHIDNTYALHDVISVVSDSYSPDRTASRERAIQLCAELGY